LVRGLRLRPAGLPRQRSHALRPRGEAAARAGQVEDQVAQVAPGHHIGRLSSHQAQQRLEASAAQPEFTVQRHTRQPFDEGLGGCNAEAAAKTQHAAVP
jgi:hypothetical protein